ncbi:probable polygalacturonase [Rutidosis leptorrhynchoides]|uniref:probable polygalacturonase n=1 Tax=Rutidosis leptorrhynchoides TaxID=125765 RepID=UPI003A9A3059
MEANDYPILNKLIAAVKKPSWAFPLLLFTLVFILILQTTTNESGFPTRPDSDPGFVFGLSGSDTCDVLVLVRAVKVSIVEFGGVGDGVTSNTAAFTAAMTEIKKFENKGGAQLNVPRGKWVTASFNLTSNFTLFLEDGAVIMGSEDMKEWPIIEPLPSYGRGRKRLGGRHISLIHGDGLTDVVIAGKPSYLTFFFSCFV